ncbi:SdpA family antimicrobial peptide system protein [Longispora urticae]
MHAEESMRSLESSFGSGTDQAGQGADEASAERGFRLTAGMLLTCLIVGLVTQLPLGVAPSWLEAQRGTYRLIWPQGWGFFSAAATMEVTVAYRASSDGSLMEMATQPGAAPENLWGLDRRGYSQLLEVYDLARQIPGNRWAACNDERACVAERRSTTPLTVRNRSRLPTVCGVVALVGERLDAQGTYSGRDMPRRPVRTVVLRVTCE